MGVVEINKYTHNIVNLSVEVFNIIYMYYLLGINPGAATFFTLQHPTTCLKLLFTWTLRMWD